MHGLRCTFRGPHQLIFTQMNKRTVLGLLASKLFSPRLHPPTLSGGSWGAPRPVWRCNLSSASQREKHFPSVLHQLRVFIDWNRLGSTTSFCPDQLPVRPSSCGSECRDTTRSEDTDQTVSQQHHPHLPHLLLSVSPDAVNTDSAGTGLRLHCRCVCC